MINNLDIDRLNKEFTSAEPFPHIVIDNFLSEDVLKVVLNEFPKSDSELFTWKSNDANSIKLMCQDRKLIKKLPNIDRLIDELNGTEFLTDLSTITDMPKLYGDSELSGGGIHQIKKGGFLKLHVDFNVADTLPDLHRRLNIILFLNESWDSDWNGQLELWNNDCTECVVSVEPIFNRAVIFDTQPSGDRMAWHGHPTPLTCPDGVTRKSLALYYYTKENSSNTLSEKHKTIYTK